jgi:hypothetical protein
MILILRLWFPKDFWLPDPNPGSDFGLEQARGGKLQNFAKKILF